MMKRKSKNFGTSVSTKMGMKFLERADQGIIVDRTKKQADGKSRHTIVAPKIFRPPHYPCGDADCRTCQDFYYEEHLERMLRNNQEKERMP